jgi:hypothetical protein
MTIFERWFFPTVNPYQEPTVTTITGMPLGAF